MTVDRGARSAVDRTAPAHRDLVEREDELRDLRQVIDAAHAGEGRFVLIEGEAGIGKSTLLDAAASLARSSGLRVLRGRGGELERLYVNGVVVELFGPTIQAPEERDRRLVGMAASAAPVFGLPGSAAEDALATVHGLYWLTVSLATEQPLLIAVDDAHWADAGSLRFLSYLSRRIEDLPVVVAAAVRPADGEQPPELHELRGLPTARRVMPGRLTPHGVEAILRDRGVATDAATVEACWSATRGNPLYVHEVASHPEGASALVAGESTPEPLALAVRHRVGLLDRDAREVAEAVAVLGDEARPDRVARLAHSPRDQVHAAIRRLTDALVLERDALSFSHPIVRGSVYAAIPPVTRADLHRRAGLLLADDAAMPDAVAAQLLKAEPTGDPRIVALLQDGARAARAQGEAAAAVRYLERGLAEPPTQAERPGLVAELAAAEAAIGSPAAATRYQEALAVATSDAARAALQLELGHTLIAAADWSGAASAFRRGLELVGDEDPRLAARLEADYVSSSWISMTAGPEVDEILSRMQRASSVTPEQRELLISRAFQQASAAVGTAAELAGTVLRAIKSVSIDELVRAGQTVELATGVLATTDELDAEIDLLTRAIEAVPRTGRYSKLGVYSYCRAWPRYFEGDLVNAAADVEAAVHAHELGWETFFPVAAGLLAFCCLERGELDAAIRAVGVVDPDAWGNRLDTEGFVPIARGRILLEQGDATAAAEHFLAAGAAVDRIGMRTPGPFDWRSWASVSLARSGDRTRAHEIAAELLEIAGGWGAQWPLAIALRTMGEVTRGSQGLELLEESVAVARRSPARLEEVRCLVALGEVLRRHGARIDARQRLSEGIDLAHRLGAHALLDRAQRELRAAGGRPRRYAVTGREALTPSETRVAELAAAGRTNRQVAEALFVTPKAVEFHLGNAYRKLAIDGRAKLAVALSGDEAGAPG